MEGSAEVKAVFFDLFFTLINPVYSDIDNEYDILDISREEWEHYSENRLLYEERAIGKVKKEEEIIERIINTMPHDITLEQRHRLLDARLNRIRKALVNTHYEIIDTLEEIKKKNIKIGLISNADVIDRKYWSESCLASFFDDAVFSCDVAMVKPNKEIYELAMKRLNVSPSESMFVGDGGDNEIFGAKQAGMRTVYTEFIRNRSDECKKELLPYADYHIKHFSNILKFI